MEITTHLVNQLLKRKNVWITTARLKTMEFFLKNNSKILCQDEIINALQKKGLSRITIYRTLIYFCDIDIIYKILDSKSKPFYSIEAGIHPTDKETVRKYNEHYHFNCIQCGRLIRLPESAVNTALPSGHIKTANNFLLLGYCDNCSKGKKTKKS